MTDRELMQQALEALLWEYGWGDPKKPQLAAITALRERLAQPEQEPVRFSCTVIDDAHLNGVPLSQWGEQHEMQPCAGRNCGSTNPNLHSAECFEDYEKSTGMNQWQGLTDEEMKSIQMQSWNKYPDQNMEKFDAWKCQQLTQSKLREKNHG